MSSQVDEKDAMAAKFREVFEAKKASGLAPAESAVEALRWLEAMSRLSKSKKEVAYSSESDAEETFDFVRELESKLRSAAKGETSWGQAMSLIYRVFSSIDELDAALGAANEGGQGGNTTRRKRKRGDHTDESASSSSVSSSSSSSEFGVPRAARACFAAIDEAATRKEALRNAVDNALDGLALELMARQGDAKATTAWMVALAYPKINEKPKLLRSTLVSMGACGGRHRDAFVAAAKRSASTKSRRKWGSLAKDFFANLVTRGADHSEILVAARCCDVLKEVDDKLQDDIQDTVNALNDRLNDEEHVVLDAYRAWLPDEPRGDHDHQENNLYDEHDDDDDDDKETDDDDCKDDDDDAADQPEDLDAAAGHEPDDDDDDLAERATENDEVEETLSSSAPAAPQRRKKTKTSLTKKKKKTAKAKKRGSLVFPAATEQAMRLTRAGTSILSYPYLLDAASKARFLRAESRRAMSQAARDELQRTITTAEYRAAPYLAIRVRRKRCVQDALSTIIAAKDEDLRKQLKVQFSGEDGVDEGGVANEFMHVVTKELLSPDHGMFAADDESNLLWFSRRRSKRKQPSGTDAASSATRHHQGEEAEKKPPRRENNDDQNDNEDQGEEEKAPQPGDSTTTTSSSSSSSSSKKSSSSSKRKKSQFDEFHEFELVGILLGVAIHNSILVDAPFCKYLFKKLLDPELEPTLEDLAEAAPAIARSLRVIMASAQSGPGPGSSSGSSEEPSFETLYPTLSFEASYRVSNGGGANGLNSVAVAELAPDGASKPVTRENAAEYVRSYVRWYLCDSVDSAFAAFKRGFDRVVEDGHVWRLLTPADLELLIRGSPTLDFEALRTAATYEDGYDEDSETVTHFWHVVEDLDELDKLKLLKFVTGSDRAPIRGLGAARFVISRSAAVDQLPSSHTCFSHLVLPDYKDVTLLRNKLLVAITESNEGFGLR